MSSVRIFKSLVSPKCVNLQDKIYRLSLMSMMKQEPRMQLYAEKMIREKSLTAKLAFIFCTINVSTELQTKLEEISGIKFDTIRVIYRELCEKFMDNKLGIDDFVKEIGKINY